jgi:hypothetical protein
MSIHDSVQARLQKILIRIRELNLRMGSSKSQFYVRYALVRTSMQSSQEEGDTLSFKAICLPCHQGGVISVA